MHTDAVFDLDLDNVLKVEADSPPTKMNMQKTLDQPSVASKDHSMFTLLQYMKESDQQYRRDAEAERAY